ncbi:MAG: autotransporter-associated beta strand repeat-containing protein [Kiritimatiellae bacterium]|nr:autotransporter-associated beta strand repeat-containing protein [Kiritimatiellia bacterium]
MKTKKNSYLRNFCVAALVSLLAQCVWAATVTITNTDKGLTGDAVANWQFSGITVPAVDGQLAVGDIVKVTSISLGCRDEDSGHPTAAIKIGDALSSSRELSSDNWLSVPVAKKVTYTFDNLYLKVGTSATMTACDANGTAGNFRMALYNCEAAREQRVVTSSNFTASNNYTLPYEITVDSDPDKAVSFDTTIGGAKPTEAEMAFVSEILSLGAQTEYDQTIGERSAEVVKLVGSTAATYNIYGGWNTSATGGTLNKDVWINAVSGSYNAIIGGSFCNWGGAKKVSSGNVTIEVGGNTAVRHIVGGYFQDANDPTWNGDVYIVVKDDAVVAGSIIGASTTAHNRTTTFTGNTHVTIKNLQNTTTEGSIVSGGAVDSSGYIVGGGMWGWNSAGTQTLQGNTEVVVSTEMEGTFSKNIVGGGFVPANQSASRNNPTIKVDGNTAVTISAPNAKFTGTLVAGGYVINPGNPSTPVTGTATLTLNGGDFSEATLLAGTATGNKILNVNMDMTLDAATIASSGFTHVNIGSGKKLTVNVTEDTTLTTIFGGAGTLVKSGVGTLTLNADNTFTGGLEVEAGTIKTGSTKKGFGPYDGTANTANMSVIKVAEGAVLDVANIAGDNYGNCYKVELAGELTNSGAAMSTNSRQLAVIKVTGDKAKITGTNTYCLLNSGWDSTSLDLNNHTLEIAMDEGKIFHLRTTSITGTGTINITSGQLHITTGTSLASGSDVTIKIKHGATFDDGLDIFNVSKILPTEVNYNIVRNDKTYSSVLRDASTLYLIDRNVTQFKLENGTAVTLIDGDEVVINDNYTGGQWGTGINLNNLKGHKVTIEKEMDLGAGNGIPEGMEIVVNFKDFSNSNDLKGVYLYGNIGANAKISGTGALFLGFTSDSTSIADGVSISCTSGFQKSNKTAPISGNVAITGDIVVAGTSVFKLADNATLTVAAKLADGKVISAVATKRVVYNGGVYSLETIQPEPPTPTEGGITPSIPGADTIEITVATGSGEETVTGNTIPLVTGVYTVTGKVGEMVVATETLAVVKTKDAESGSSPDPVTTAVAVPFTGATVANLLNTALLTPASDEEDGYEGDILKALNPETQNYQSWKLVADAETGAKSWSPITTVRAGAIEDASDPATTVLPRGSAVWVTTAGQVVAFGAYTDEAVEPEVTTGYNLIGNPMMEPITPEAKTVGDVLIPIGGTELVRYTVIDKGNGEKAWQCTKSVPVTIPGLLDVSGSEEDISEEDPTVPVGGSVWLIK